MIVAGVVIETLPGKAPGLVPRLARMEGLRIHGGDGDRRLAAVWTASDAQTLERLAEALVASVPDVVGVFPTFVGQSEDAIGPGARCAAIDGHDGPQGERDAGR